MGNGYIWGQRGVLEGIQVPDHFDDFGTDFVGRSPLITNANSKIIPF